MDGGKVIAPGFTVCKECGRVKQDERKRHNRAQHDFDCPYAKNPEKAEWLEGLVLYREYQSEALRIRLPSGLFAAQYHPQVLTASLTAALRLGLKHYFHGSVDHLRFTVIEEPEADAEKRRYILVYDTVPGGTGYLKELMSVPENLIGVLRKALDVMVNCDCGGDPEAKGCYKCVYQYRDAASRVLISKLCAIDVLTELTDDNKTIRQGDIDRGSGNGDGDSELEARFIRALGASTRVREMIRCQEGTTHYLVRMESGKLWRMDLQVDFTGDAPSRPDFVLRPMKEAERTKDLEMAIFTDGWRYHADIVHEDCAKRQSLLNTGRHVWTLSWHDVPAEEAGFQHEDLRADNLLIRSLPLKGVIATFYERWCAGMQKIGRGEYLPLAKLLADWVEKKNSLDRLLLWMENPEEARKAAEALVFLRAMQTMVTDDGKRLPGITLRGDTSVALSTNAAQSGGGFGLFRSSLRDWSSVHDVKKTYRTAFYADPEYFALRKDDPAASPASQSLRRFWATVNVAGLAEGVLLYPAPLPEDGSDPVLIDRMPWRRAVDDLSVRPGTILPVPTTDPLASAEPPKSEAETLWEEAKTYLPDSLFALADELKRTNVPIDLENIGFEYASDDGGIETVFELYWPEAKVAVLFEPETAPKGIVALDAALPAEELAPRIVEALARN